MKFTRKVFLCLCLLLTICITGCKAEQTYEILSTDDEKLGDISLKDWKIKNDTLYHETSNYRIMNTYQFNHDDFMLCDTNELLSLFNTSFNEKPVYQTIDEEVFTKKKAVRMIIQLSDDSQAPCEIEINSPISLKTFIISSNDTVSDHIIKKLKDTNVNLEEKSLPMNHKFNINEENNNRIYGIYFIPFYECIYLKDEGIEYQIYQPVLKEDKSIDGVFVEIEKPNPLL